MPASGSSLRYEKIQMFYHRQPETYIKFIFIKTYSGKTLSLTRKNKLFIYFIIRTILALHLLPFGDCEEMIRDGLKMEDIQNWLRKAR